MFPAIAAIVDIASAEEGVVFAVSGDNDVLGRSRAHGFPHHLLALDAASVIGEGDTTAFEGVEIHQLESAPPLRDGAIGEYPDEGVPVDGFLFHGQMLQGVWHGIQVGHGANERVSAPRGGPAAAADGFFPGLSRLTEVYVKVGEGRELYHAEHIKKRQPVRAAYQ
jgi:hypothetical protein